MIYDARIGEFLAHERLIIALSETHAEISPQYYKFVSISFSLHSMQRRSGPFIIDAAKIKIA